MLLTFQVHAQIKYITTYHYTIQCTLLRYICHEHTNHKFMNCFFMFIFIQNVHLVGHFIGTFYWYILHLHFYVHLVGHLLKLHVNVQIICTFRFFYMYVLLCPLQMYILNIIFLISFISNNLV